VPKDDGIDLSDLSRLRVIAHLESRGARQMAKGIASDINEPAAREVANLLTQTGTSTNSAVRKLADHFRQSVKVTGFTSSGGSKHSGNTSVVNGKRR
jgi:hypothetical protein